MSIPGELEGEYSWIAPVGDLGPAAASLAPCFPAILRFRGARGAVHGEADGCRAAFQERSCVWTPSKKLAVGRVASSAYTCTH